MSSPIINREALLEKFSGKGGWTYISVPEIDSIPNIPFGWVIVNGNIDNYQFTKSKLMPFGNGKLFLPVNASIRKNIKKQAGDSVWLTLYLEELPLEIPEELMECFLQEKPIIHEKFKALSQKQQHFYINLIYSSKTEDEKAQRILKLMEMLESMS